MSLKLEVEKRKALKKLSNYSNVVLINSSLILEKKLCSRLRDAVDFIEPSLVILFSCPQDCKC